MSALPIPGADTDAEEEEEAESFPAAAADAAADSSSWELPSGPPRSLSSSYSRGGGKRLIHELVIIS